MTAKKPSSSAGRKTLPAAKSKSAKPKKAAAPAKAKAAPAKARKTAAPAKARKAAAPAKAKKAAVAPPVKVVPEPEFVPLISSAAPRAGVPPAERKPTEPGSAGYLLDSLDLTHPVPPELGTAARPYWWEDECSSMRLVGSFEGSDLEGSAFVLKYWENNSGGEGWGWRLGFDSAREAIDFACVVGRGLSCEDEDEDQDYEDMTEAEVEAQQTSEENGEPTLAMLSLATLRNAALARLADTSRGVDTDALKAIWAELNGNCRGTIEFFGSVSELVAGTREVCVDLRRSFWRGHVDEGSAGEECADDDDDDDDEPEERGCGASCGSRGSRRYRASSGYGDEGLSPIPEKLVGTYLTWLQHQDE